MKLKDNIKYNDIEKLGFKIDYEIKYKPILTDGILGIFLDDLEIRSLEYIENTDENQYQESLYKLFKANMIEESDKNGNDRNR